MARDLTESQFRTAAKRHGFKPEMLGLYDAETRTTYGYAFSAGPRGGRFKIHYRTSLSRAINERRKRAKRAAAPTPAA